MNAKKIIGGNNRKVFDLQDGTIIKFSDIQPIGWQEALAYETSIEARQYLLPVKEHGRFFSDGKIYYYEIMDKLNTSNLLDADVAARLENVKPFLGAGDMASASQWGKTQDGNIVLFDYKDWRNKEPQKYKTYLAGKAGEILNYLS